ncbi:MAG: small ribosomal subunit Rsm22 family protein [Pseudomonadota bacterium]|nr:small ribosomal subunit Rsm22 family protein [Pseudomonadota bacterium]
MTEKIPSFPESLARATEQLAADLSAPARKKAAADVTAAYRTDRDRLSLGRTEKLAYLLTRLPATWAVAARCLSELQRKKPDFRPRSILDAGAGPGTTAWAVAACFGQPEAMTLLERDGEWITVGQTLFHLGQFPDRHVLWRREDLTDRNVWPASDLVVASYALNELPPAALPDVIRRLWAATQGALVLAEPGSRQGFETVRQAREILLAGGARILAPCPHAKACPMPADNWCHFPQDIRRSALHREAKAAALDHGTEKFSYVIAVRPGLGIAETPASRVVSAPLHRSGHVRLDLCTPEGQLKRETVSRRDKTLWSRVRKTDWGDEWPG